MPGIPVRCFQVDCAIDDLLGVNVMSPGSRGERKRKQAHWEDIQATIVQVGGAFVWMCFECVWWCVVVVGWAGRPRNQLCKRGGGLGGPGTSCACVVVDWAAQELAVRGPASSICIPVRPEPHPFHPPPGPPTAQDWALTLNQRRQNAIDTAARHHRVMNPAGAPVQPQPQAGATGVGPSGGVAAALEHGQTAGQQQQQQPGGHDGQGPFPPAAPWGPGRMSNTVTRVREGINGGGAAADAPHAQLPGAGSGREARSRRSVA